MANIIILLKHFRMWISDDIYDGYKIDEIIIKNSDTYNNLVETISTQVQIDQYKKGIEIRYTVKENSTPIKIQNEMNMELFVYEIKMIHVS